MNGSFVDIYAKVLRANKHIQELDIYWDDCRKAHPHKTRTQRDLLTGDVTYFVEDMTPISSDIPLIAGDIVQNLRAALDHLVWAMVDKVGGNPGTHTSFPIFDTVDEYSHPKKGAARKVAGLPEIAIREIDRLQPYQGGNEKLWLLHKLSNIDKHRLLITVGQHVSMSTLLPSQRKQLGSFYQIGHPGSGPLEFSGMFMNLSQPRAFSPLKIGDELCTVPAQDANEEMNFAFGIAFNEVGVNRGNNIFLVLRLISSEVSLILNDMGRFL